MFIGTCSVTTAPVSAFTKKSDSMLIFHSCSRLLGIRLTVGDLHDGLHSHLRPADIDYWYLAFVDWACQSIRRQCVRQARHKDKPVACGRKRVSEPQSECANSTISRFVLVILSSKVVILSLELT